MKRPADYWLDHPILDWPLCVITATAAHQLHPGELLDNGPRATAYQTFTEVSGVLLTVGLIVITLVFTVTPTPRLERVLTSVGPRLRRLVMSCILGLIVSTVGTAGLYVIGDSHPHLRDFVTVLLFSLMALRFGRLWWLIGKILDVLLPTVPMKHGQPPSDQPWASPVIRPGDYQEPVRK